MTEQPTAARAAQKNRDADYVFYELTRSICPDCRRVINAQVLLRENRVYMRKRCPEHGSFEALIYGDAEAYTGSARFNKPGTIPLRFTMEIDRGCPHDCGLCPDHQQHACLGIIEVNSGCNMACPLCFANAGHGFNLTLEEVEGILDHLVETEGTWPSSTTLVLKGEALLRLVIYERLDIGLFPLPCWPHLLPSRHSVNRLGQLGINFDPSD